MLDFLDGSAGALVGAGFTPDGGRIGIGSDAVLRVSGSTGGTIGVDFFPEAGATGAEGARMAAVLLGVSGSEEAGDVIGGTTGGTVEVVRRGNVEGGAAISGGAVGNGGGFAMEAATAGAASGNGAGGASAAGGDGTSGGCGVSGSGRRPDFVSATGAEAASGGTVVGAVAGTGSPDVFLRSSAVSFVIIGSVPVVGSAGGLLRCSTGEMLASWSVLPVTKTLACGFAMITRGGAGTRPEAVGTTLAGAPETGSGGGMFGGVNGVVAEVEPLPGTSPVSGGALEGEANVAFNGEVFEPGIAVAAGGEGRRGAAGVGRTSGSVFAREPVSEADCFSCDGAGPTRPVGGRVGFCIGCVTAVDHAGGFVAPGVGVGAILSDPFIGMVAAVPELARDNWVESGFSGRGGRETRNVSRF